MLFEETLINHNFQFASIGWIVLEYKKKNVNGVQKTGVSLKLIGSNIKNLIEKDNRQLK